MVALVRGVHGLNGAVRVEALTDRPDDRFGVGRRLFVEGSDTPLTIVAGVADGPGWRLRLAEVPDRAAAEALRGRYLEASVTADDALARGEYYWHEVIGATVRDLAGTEIGTVVDVYRAGGVDAYVVRGDAFAEFDVPAVRDFVRIFAPRRGEIVVDAEALDLTPARPRPDRPPRPRRATRRRPAVRGPGVDASGAAPAEQGSQEAGPVGDPGGAEAGG